MSRPHHNIPETASLARASIAHSVCVRSMNQKQSAQRRQFFALRINIVQRECGARLCGRDFIFDDVPSARSVPVR